MNAQPRTIPNPLWCEKCEGRGYVVYDAEWEPYAVKCDCAALTAAQAGAPSEEDVERMICEWWGRTGRGILETSAINDLTRAVLALLRRTKG